MTVKHAQFPILKTLPNCKSPHCFNLSLPVLCWISPLESLNGIKGREEERKDGNERQWGTESKTAREKERGWVLSVIALWLPVKLQNLLNTLVEAASGMFSALLLHGRHLAWCWGVKREEMVQQEFSSSVWIICSVCLAGKWPGECPPHQLLCWSPC